MVFLLVSWLVLSYSLTIYFLCLNKVYSYLPFRPNFLPRITLANIWEPASRESCDNNIWEIVKTSFRILFGRSTLQVCGKLISGCTCMVIVMKRRQCVCVSWINVWSTIVPIIRHVVIMDGHWWVHVSLEHWCQLENNGLKIFAMANKELPLQSDDLSVVLFVHGCH